MSLIKLKKFTQARIGLEEKRYSTQNCRALKTKRRSSQAQDAVNSPGIGRYYKKI